MFALTGMCQQEPKVMSTTVQKFDLPLVGVGGLGIV